MSGETRPLLVGQREQLEVGGSSQVLEKTLVEVSMSHATIFPVRGKLVHVIVDLRN